MSDTSTPEYSLQELQKRFGNEYQTYLNATGLTDRLLALSGVTAIVCVVEVLQYVLTRDAGVHEWNYIPFMGTAAILCLVAYSMRPSKMKPLIRRVEEAGNSYAHRVFDSTYWRIRWVDYSNGRVIVEPIKPGVDLTGVTFYASHTDDPGLSVQLPNEGISAKRIARIVSAPWYQAAIRTEGSDTVLPPMAPSPA